MSICTIGERSVPLHFFLDDFRRFALCIAGAVSDTEYMSVHGNGRLFERNVHDDAGGFLADAGKLDQGIKVRRHLTVVMLDQVLTEFHHVLRLASVKPDVLDDVREFFRA